MRQGCISLGKVQCDGCRNTIPYAERYLLIDEENGVEVESGKKSCYCVNCSLDKGYARYRQEKNERVLTFFPVEPEPQDITPQDLVQ
ncbi:MAG TPA: hypothetical protein VMW13_04515 [Dehalococcoidales bacterium]|nr:hypothetical protein [Dehalococcoidales bacterium]